MENKILELPLKLSEKLNYENINYCHFKSNEHIDASFSGDTDLDILFDNTQYDKIKTILLELGFRKFNAAWFVDYPFVEDYIAIDSGKIIHVHAHFKLILGESKVKSYILPWENDFFKNRVLLDKYNIYISSPVEETLLLIIRMALKLPASPKDYMNKRDTIDACREFEWLKEKVTANEIIKLSYIKLELDLTNEINEIYSKNITYENLHKFYDKVIIKLNEYRRYSMLTSKVVKLARRIAQKISTINKKLNLIDLFKNHRTLDGDGIIISIMGSDGSGKSTQVGMVKDILIKKMDVRYIYMGSGEGPSSWHRNLLKLLKKLISKPNNKQVIEDIPENKKGNKLNKLTFKNILKLIYIISLAIEKSSKLQKLQAYKKRGMMSITDRYPQIQITGYNDGPLLFEYLNSDNFIIKLFAKYEYNLYKRSIKMPPDLVVKLIGDPKILYSRRSDEITLEMLRRKQDGIKQLKFTENTTVAELNSNNTIQSINLEIMNLISKEMKDKK